MINKKQYFTYALNFIFESMKNGIVIRKDLYEKAIINLYNIIDL